MSHYFGCGICGEMSRTREAVKTCFFKHLINGEFSTPQRIVYGCGICGEICRTGDAAKTCFNKHCISECDESTATSNTVQDSAVHRS